MRDVQALARQGDQELFELLRSLPAAHARREAVCEVLVRRYEFLVRAAVSRYRNSPEPVEDLMAMRFYGNMTQAEIGQRLGISQMHVSRLLTAALNYLRQCLLGELAPDQA